MSLREKDLEQFSKKDYNISTLIILLSSIMKIMWKIKESEWKIIQIIHKIMLL